jgi:4-hydroxy-tetrahydrodipicolinate synthase
MFALTQEGAFTEAMKLFWKIHPARLANLQAMSLLAGSNFLHRMLWKYQGWLQGFNGGPLRQPTMRLVDRQLRPLRGALEQCGLNPWPEPDGDFFVGRNPA